MSVSEKKLEESQRLRYIRLLERTANSIVIFVQKSEVLSFETLSKRVTSKLDLLNKGTKVALRKGDYLDLESFVYALPEKIASSESIETLKQQIVYEYNQLQKRANAKKYKKNKHAKSYLHEWE